VGGVTERGVESVAAVAAAVVGDDSLDGDPDGGVERGGSGPEPGCGGALLVVEDFAVRDPRVRVDGGVHVRIPDLGAVMLTANTSSAMSSPATTTRDTTQLLNVHVDQLTSTTRRDTTDRCSGRPVEVLESIELMTDQHPMGGRGMHAHDPRDTRGSETPRAAQ
jgi:hypothetical protein